MLVKTRRSVFLFAAVYSLLHTLSVNAVELGAFGNSVFQFQKRMASKGNTSAEYKLGTFYEFGISVPSNIEEATKQCLENVKQILKGVGLHLGDIVKASIFMINTEDYSGMDLTYSQIVPQPYPAREAVFVTALPKDARVEISVIAKTRS